MTWGTTTTSTFQSLKKIMEILAATTILNAVYHFVITDSKPRQIADFSIYGIVIFCLLLVNIFRFFHGNIQHINETWIKPYLPPAGYSGLRMSVVRHSRLDFLAILAESLILTILSFYQANIHYFFFILTSLLALDVGWFVASVHTAPDRRTENYQRFWAVNNLIAVYLSLILLSSRSDLIETNLVLILGSVMLLNAMMDFYLNRDLYIPSKGMPKFKVFLAAPLTSRLRPLQSFDRRMRRRLEVIMEFLASGGHEVISAHVREKWGKERMRPEDFAPLDLQGIKDCDFIIALVEPERPTGVYVELGWASAMGKEIIVLNQLGQKISPMIDGLATISKVKMVTYKDDKDLIDKLAKTLRSSAHTS